MVQVLPYVPSNAERIAPAVAQGFNNAYGAYKEGQVKQKDEQILKSLEDPNMTPIQKLSAIASLSPDRQKAYATLYDETLKQQEKTASRENNFKTFAEGLGLVQPVQNQPQQMQPSQNQQMPQQSTPSPITQSPGVVNPQPQQMQQQPPSQNAQRAEISNQQGTFNLQDPSTWSDKDLVFMSGYSKSAEPELRIKGDQAKEEASRRKLIKEQDRADERLEKTIKSSQDRLDKNLSSQRERDIFSKNEPVLVEMGKELHSLHNQSADYGRLEKLFETGKFPNAKLSSFFTEDGQLNDKAYALLEPEAQEALKIIVNSLAGAQKTFGGKVSNFEAATFLRGQPGLLNSPEAKKNILHNLNEVNKFNTDYIKGVLQVVDKNGGASKIPLSKVLEIYNKENEGKIEKHKEEFAKGREKTTFKSLPDPKSYPEGRFAKDTNTGQLYRIKNGKWTKFEEPKE